MADWKNYQETAATFFRSLGMSAQTDATIHGVRTKHDIDVLVCSHHAGFDIQWLVECKHWRTKVTKLHVLALREIVSDTGSDRGILLAENGYQSGALEAAELTNVQLTTLADLSISAKEQICSMKLNDCFDLLMWCKQTYWDIPKSQRIAHGVRQEFELGYSGDWAMKAAEDLITKGLRGSFPVVPDELHLMMSSSVLGVTLPREFIGSEDLLATVEPMLNDLRTKLKRCLENARDSV